MSTPQYTVAQYIVDRLAALGARHVFQVPGNYTAEFLMRAEASKKLTCVGTSNEMEAGYAADACARLTGIGVACTTYGVGSFSILNAIAGARVERCPVVLINGGPNSAKSSDLETRGILFAHAIDTTRTDEKVFREIVAATAVITDPEDAPRQIDHVLRTCITEKKPVYLESRDGVWELPCREPADPPANQPLQPFPLSDAAQKACDQSVAAAVKAVLQRLAAAKHPVLWGGEELQRFRLEEQFERLIRLTKLKYSTTLMGKSLVPETSEGSPAKRRDEFIGVYDSVFAPDDVATVLENSDCVLALGTILSDFYGKIVQTAEATGAMILAAAGAVRVGPALYPNAPLDQFLKELIRELEKHEAEHTAQKPPPEGFESLPAAKFAVRSVGGTLESAAAPPESTPGMSWADAFSSIQKHIDKDTFVLADTSLALFPAAELLIPGANHFISQTAWLSIGYTVGAAVGVSTLMKAGERALVLAGDGGFQMTAQALATLARLRKPVTVVVLDNALYAVEQFLILTQIARDQLDFYKPGSKRPGIFFNRLEIDPAADTRWDYVSLAKAFRCNGAEAATAEDLDRELGKARAVADRPTLIAARIDPRSLPPELDRAVKPVAAAGLESAAERPRLRLSVRTFN